MAEKEKKPLTGKAKVDRIALLEGRLKRKEWAESILAQGLKGDHSFLLETMQFVIDQANNTVMSEDAEKVNTILHERGVIDGVRRVIRQLSGHIERGKKAKVELEGLKLKPADTKGKKK